MPRAPSPQSSSKKGVDALSLGEGLGGGHIAKPVLMIDPQPRPLPARGRAITARVDVISFVFSNAPYLLTLFSNVRSMALPRDTAESSASLAVF
jgi:hypothetical protein